MNSLLVYKGSEIHYEQNNGNLKVNVTEYAKAFPKKNLAQIINSAEIQEYIQIFSDIYNYSSADLLEVRKGGKYDEQGTFAHPMVAIRIAQKLSTEFSIMVDTKIQELLTTGKTTLYKTNGIGLQVGERTFMPYGYVLERLEIPYNKYSMIAAIGRNKSEFIMYFGVWYVSEQYSEYLENLKMVKMHRRIFKEQNRVLTENNMRMNSLFPQIEKS